jgi:hypothetical protein
MAASIPERVGILEKADAEHDRRLTVVEGKQETQAGQIVSIRLKLAWMAGAAVVGSTLGHLLVKYVLGG